MLWSAPDTTFESLSMRFAQYPGSVPSDYVPRKDAIPRAGLIREQFAPVAVPRFGVCVCGTGEYPEKLRDAAHPIGLRYYQGC